MGAEGSRGGCWGSPGLLVPWPRLPGCLGPFLPLMSLITAMAAGRGPRCCPPGTAAAVPIVGARAPPSPQGSLPAPVWGSCGAQLPLPHCTSPPAPAAPQPRSPSPPVRLSRAASCCRRSWLSSANPLILPPGQGCRGLGRIQHGGCREVLGGLCPMCWPWGAGSPGGDTPGGEWGRALPAQEFPFIYETKPKPPLLLPKPPPLLPASPARPAPGGWGCGSRGCWYGGRGARGQDPHPPPQPP